MGPTVVRDCADRGLLPGKRRPVRDVASHDKEGGSRAARSQRVEGGGCVRAWPVIKRQGHVVATPSTAVNRKAEGDQPCHGGLLLGVAWKT